MKAVNKNLLLTCIASILAFTGMQTSYAQDGATVEEVIVTGSRIRRNILDEPAPVLSISEETLEKTGLTNLGSVLQTLPISGSAINSRDNVPGNSGFPQDGTGIGAGAIQVSLRNLGSKRTLVLVDGKRWIAGASASGVPTAVDLNTIPANAIKSVEILQDGASAIYGSDAIGGVVNIITNRDFSGIKVDAQSGSFLSENDGENKEFSLLVGGGNDDTHFTLSASYNEEGEVFTSDRAVSAFPRAFASSCDAGGCSSFTPQGRFILGPNFNFDDLALNDGVLNDGGANIAAYDPLNPLGGDFHAFSSADRFNFNGNGFNYLKTPNERINLYADVRHALTDTIDFNLKTVYTNRKSATGAAPEPLCLGNGCGNRILDNIVIDADQIYNPFGVDLSVANGNLEFFGRRPLESGARIFQQDINTYFLSAGLEGQLTRSDRDYFWDLTASYGDNRGFQQKFNSHNAAKLAVALGDPDVCAATPNCVPFNLFGGQGPNGTGSISQDQLDFVTYTQRDFSEQTLKDFSGNISSELMDLTAGPLAFAAGFEFRDHAGSFQPDPIAERGETAGIPSGATKGEFDVLEFYGELNIPLLDGVRGADYLEVNVAARTSDYSNFGSEETFKLGALWRPSKDLSVRGSLSSGIRAPGIGELFGGAARSDFTFTDPCADVLGTIGSANGGRDAPQAQNIITNCAALGIPVSLAQRNPQLSAISGGNENLVAETSDNISLGFVYNPAWIDNVSWAQDLSASIDYNDIDIEDAIQGRNPGDVITACVLTLDASFCDAVSRSANGIINLVDNQLQNIGSIETSGLDIGINYRAPDFRYGSFGVNFSATHLLDYVESTSNTDGTVSTNDLTGQITNETFQRAFPEWKLNTTVNWDYDRWNANLNFRTIGEMTQPAGTKFDGQTFTDLQVGYNPGFYGDRVKITVGANNIFDNDPTVCDPGVCGSTSISGTVHDIPGVFGYFRISVAQLTE